MDLKLDDLIGKCDACGGTGKKPPSVQRGRQIVTYTGSMNADECAKCQGTGRWGLTSAGQAVAELFTILQKYEQRGWLYSLVHGGGNNSAT